MFLCRISNSLSLLVRVALGSVGFCVKDLMRPSGSCSDMARLVSDSRSVEWSLVAGAFLRERERLTKIIKHHRPNPGLCHEPFDCLDLPLRGSDQLLMLLGSVVLFGSSALIQTTVIRWGALYVGACQVSHAFMEDLEAALHRFYGLPGGCDPVATCENNKFHLVRLLEGREQQLGVLCRGVVLALQFSGYLVFLDRHKQGVRSGAVVPTLKGPGNTPNNLLLYHSGWVVRPERELFWTVWNDNVGKTDKRTMAFLSEVQLALSFEVGYLSGQYTGGRGLWTFWSAGHVRINWGWWLTWAFLAFGGMTDEGSEGWLVQGDEEVKVSSWRRTRAPFCVRGKSWHGAIDPGARARGSGAVGHRLPWVIFPFRSGSRHRANLKPEPHLNIHSLELKT
jgi:hypothetical protein